MNSERTVAPLEVCKYLLKCEFLKGKFDSDASSFSDDQIRQAMTTLGQQQPENPAVVWLGYSSKHQRKAVSWKHELDIDVRAVISKGLNPAWKSKLQEVNGNLFRFVTECQSTYKTEYDQSRSLSSELSLIIGIVHPEKPNEVELVDGSHRLASMILNTVKHVQGYVGYY